ncbi:hypothetical protein LSH36_54g05030 [Paralvinella palmiformis]|uniref:Cadherin domain-containing protein n=1 Tax=Paralvinella palmiformis TaxID=53620 RepID=A0AAD9K6Z0_9ANNE|nr:hypothetical protein LSH36_54g05030 [Paralvinella palmiformis]
MALKSGVKSTRCTYGLRSVLLLACASMCMNVALAGTLSLNYGVKEEEVDRSLGDILVDSGLSQRYNSSISQRIKLSILKGIYARYFVISPRSNVLRTSDIRLDRDAICPKLDSCVVQLDVAVSEPIALFEIIKINVTVEDLNDNAPSFPEPEATVRISESADPGTPMALPLAFDYDSGASGNVSYDLYPESSIFDLEFLPAVMGSPDLRLVTTGSLDRETESEYKLEIEAKDNGNPQLSTTLQVRVMITDSNDNTPIFNEPLYDVTIPEDYPLSTPFIALSATDMDVGDNGVIVYAFSQQTALLYGATFGLDPNSGDLFLVSGLDYETSTSYYLTVLATDKGPEARRATARVTVRVKDINDVTPRVTINVLTSSGVAEVAENHEAGQFVAHLSVEDPDGGQAGDVSCNVSNTDQFVIVEIYDNEFKLVTNSSFDHEYSDSVTVSVTCSDKGLPPLSTTETLRVTILDENDNIPQFLQQSYTTNIRENNTFPVPIFFVSAIDKDGGVNGKVSYHVDESGEKYIQVNTTSGLVSSNGRFDREQIEYFTTLIYAVDGGSPPLTGTSTITVLVDDINDEAPYFTQKTYVFGTFENQIIGTTIGQVAAQDNDTGPRADVVYTLTPDSRGKNIFKIDPETGRISTKKILDREEVDSYVLEIMATNTMYPYYTATATVSIHIADKNDLAPTIVFPSKVNDTVQISAFAARGSSVTKIEAYDADLGKNSELVYQLAKGNDDDLFIVNPASGEVILQQILDGRQRVYNILVVVQDQGKPKKAAVANLYIVLNSSIGASSSGVGNADSKRLRAGQTGDGLTMEMTIVIIVGCLSAVLAGCLATLLAFLCRRYGRPESRKRADVSKNANDSMTYNDVKVDPESGADEPAITPLTSVTLAESLDQQSPGDPADRIDMWITSGCKKEELAHMDSGHGSWAESGSDCGTVAVECGTSGPRGYFRRQAISGVQEYNPRFPIGQYTTTPTAAQNSQTSPRRESENCTRSGSQTLYDDYIIFSNRDNVPQFHCSGSGRRPETFFIREPPILPGSPSPSEPMRTHDGERLRTFSGNNRRLVKDNFPDADLRLQDGNPVMTNNGSGSVGSSFSSDRSQELKPLNVKQNGTELSVGGTSSEHLRQTCTDIRDV